jgi:cellulose synthase (UDP-forming)
MSFICIAIFQMRLDLKIKNRSLEADKMTQYVTNGQFTPSVDIFIPTYNEPTNIVKQTILGCQELKYPKIAIYLLDDGQRMQMKKLSQEIGCQYIARNDNRYAKAGNLNNALFQTSGDLIAIFDADFIPTNNFLIRTVGFFQKENIALVQTNQSFYNPDAISYNLGLGNVLVPETELASRYYQVLRDGVGNVMCYGSSFIVRRKALEKIDGFVTDSVSEDIFTSIKLYAEGYDSIYLNEKLSAGLSPENVMLHFSQKERGARGAIQSFFIDSNPLTLPGLTINQRLNHLGSLVYWFNNISRFFLLIIPLFYFLLEIDPIKFEWNNFLYFMLPYYLMNISTYSWRNQYSQSFIISDIYSVIYSFPLSLSIIKELFIPFNKGFNVTSKGINNNKFIFNWHLAYPHIIMIFLNIVCLVLFFFKVISSQSVFLDYMVILLILYNFFVLSIILLALLDSPKKNTIEFNLMKNIRIKRKGTQNYLDCTTTKVSVSGSGIKMIMMTEKNNIKHIVHTQNTDIEVIFLDDNILVLGKILQPDLKKQLVQIHILFENVNLDQHRKLISMLFCNPDQWKFIQAPNELESVVLLMRSLLKAMYGSLIKINIPI